MKAFFQTHGTFLLALACYLLGGLTVWAWQQPAPPSGKVLTVKEARQDTQEALAAQAAAKTLNTQGDSARTRAAAPYVAAQQAEKHATALRTQTHAHASTPVPRAVADSVGYYTGLLAGYGQPAR